MKHIVMAALALAASTTTADAARYIELEIKAQAISRPLPRDIGYPQNGTFQWAFDSLFTVVFDTSSGFTNIPGEIWYNTGFGRIIQFTATGRTQIDVIKSGDSGPVLSFGFRIPDIRESATLLDIATVNNSYASNYNYYRNNYELTPSGAIERVRARTFDDAPPRLGLVVSQTAQTVLPEPASWAMMIVGFGLAGFLLRRRAKTGVRFA